MSFTICSESSKKKLKNEDNIKGIYIYFGDYEKKSVN